MTVKTKTKFGSINISNDAIASVVGEAVTMTYGVVGLAKKNSPKTRVNEILKKGNFTQGVFVNQIKSTVTIDIYLVIATEVKITEVLSEVQKQVKFVVKKDLGLNVKKVNVFAHSLKKVN